MNSYIRFFWQFLRNPKQTGAIAPSSRYLAREITSWIAIERAKCVVEIGPGDGAFTASILEKLSPGAVFFAMELNPDNCAAFRSRFPGVTIHCDCASKIGEYLKQAGVDHADCIVCGLPWAAFDSQLQNKAMKGAIEALRPGGRFATFAYLQGLLLPAGKRFRVLLDKHFAEVTRSRIVWRNLPPAFVYQCVKER